jgi:hypothetical protein
MAVPLVLKLLGCLLGAIFLPAIEQAGTLIAARCASCAADALIKQRVCLVFEVSPDVEYPAQVIISWEMDGTKSSDLLEIPAGRTITYSKEFARQVQVLYVVIKTCNLERKYKLKLNATYKAIIARSTINASLLPTNKRSSVMRV